LNVAITRAALDVRSAAFGAGSSPRRSRIHAAWRASTEAIFAAAASVPFVRLGACAL
jgi:hypothetical protein